jgi:FkbM family methyltransferase
MSFGPIYFAGRVFRKLGNELLRRSGIQGTWIDVGAHHGELSIGSARGNPGLRVYAIEPNLKAASKLIGDVPNYVVLPVAIAETDGCAEFYVNASEMSSSLLPINEQAKTSWVGVAELKVESKTIVPTLRLDTLMNMLGIEKVDFLKIDAQGMDLSVLRSAGSRLKDIEKIQMEVETASVPFYIGSPTKTEVLEFLDLAGFMLVSTQKQTQDQEENLTFVRKRSGKS